VKERVVRVRGDGQLLDTLLIHFPHIGRNKVKAWLTRGQVKVDQQTVQRYDHPVRAGQQIQVEMGKAGGELSIHAKQRLSIVYEDDEVVVVDKPAGLLSVATEDKTELTAYRLVTEHVRKMDTKHRIFVVHRLDRDTSGIMLFAKRYETQQWLQDNWNDVVKERRYVAVVEGRVQKQEGVIDTWLKESSTRTMYVSSPGDGLRAITHFRVLKRSSEYSLVECQLDTGRKNQIRVHMKSIGHCVVGDKRYGATRDEIGRLALHAASLAFLHPTKPEKVLRFESEIPAAFRKLFS
jgi:23S rRNA pseudouridine1911/1915/1917 synthase